MGRTGLFLFLSRHKLSHKFVVAFNRRGLLGSHVCDVKDIRYHSDNYYTIGPTAAKHFLIIKAPLLSLARLFLFGSFVSRRCFFCETERCSRLGGNERRSSLWLCVLLLKTNRLRVISSIL